MSAEVKTHNRSVEIAPDATFVRPAVWIAYPPLRNDVYTFRQGAWIKLLPHSMDGIVRRWARLEAEVRQRFGPHRRKTIAPEKS
jgi:hypothetical protein